MDENPRITDLRKKLEKDPGSRLFAQLAEELRKEGKHDEAITVARSGLEKIPNYPSARLTLARALLDSGQIRDARPELEQVVKASPDNILAGRLLGEALESLGETIAAIKQYERALALSPGDKFLIDKLGSMRYRPTRPASGQKGSTTRPPSLPGSSSPPGSISRPPSSGPPPSVFDAQPSAKPKGPAPAAAAPSASGPPKAPVAMDETLALPNVFDAPRSPAAPPPALPSVFDAPPAAPTAPLPSVFDAPAAAPVPAAGPKPASAAPKAPTPPPAPPPAPASVAFDRDLASGTFSPGSLGVAELQRHFEAQAAAEKLVQEAEAPVQQYPDVEDTVGFGELAHQPEPGAEDAPSPAFEAPLPVVATASTQVFELSETEAVPELSPEFPAEQESDVGAQTLPLNSVTLADLYLQQGLKAEASAVLSQVIRDEPSNEEAKHRLAQVSEAGVETIAEPAERFPEVDVPDVAPSFPSPSAEPQVAAQSPAPAESPSLAPVTIPFAAPVSIPAAPAAPSPKAPVVVAPPQAAPVAAPSRPPSPVPVAPTAAAKPAPPAVPSPQPVAPRPPDKPKPAAVSVPKAPSPVDAAQARAAASRGTRSHVRDRTIRLLKAFQNAAEREAVQQRASELTIR
jgi:tetratricopeptide (TPR) repeat protein